MIRIAYIVRELGRNLIRYPGTALASLLSLALLFVLFDLFWIAAGTSERFYRDLISEIRIEAFVAEPVPDSSIAAITADVITIEGIFDAEYISRERARERLAAMIGSDLLMGYDETNPLPRSFILTVDEPYLTTARIDLIEQRLRALPGLSNVYYSRNWLTKAEDTKSIIFKVGLFLGILILATALVSSANNIRLMTRARAIGFQQMLLLGAGRIFISFPYVVEGFLIGGFSAAAGWAAILYAGSKVHLSQVQIVFPTNDDIILFCIVAGLLGAISGYFGLRRMFRV